MPHFRPLFVLILTASPALLQGAEPRDQVRSFLNTHCLACHEGEDAERNFDLAPLLSDAQVDTFGDDEALAWERMLKRLRSRQMPPPESEKPTEEQYRSVVSVMQSALAARAAQQPRPGRTSTIRRLTRVEYGNAIRDLLALKTDVSELLPKDESSHGFDNITVSELSPTLLSRYLTAAETLSALAVGRIDTGPTGIVVRVPQDRSQEEHVAGLPLGTRGGVLIEHTFPQSGLYEIQIKLARDRDEKVEGLFETHQLDVLLDRQRVSRFEVKAPGQKNDGWTVDHTNADAHLRGRIEVAAGPHNVGVTFPRKWSSLNEIKRKPFDASFNRHRHPRRTPAVYEVSITGPFEPQGPGKTPSRTTIFGEGFDTTSAYDTDAKAILQRLLRLAYRRPITDEDLATPFAFYRAGRKNGDFELGMQNAIAAVLVNPNFLFRIEVDPADVKPGEAYRVDDVSLASRLSFFLWSSLPDEELLSLAEREKLHDPDVLRAQVQRMLADERAQSLVRNFAAQWLYLRNLASVTPDLRAFPDFDDNLRHAMRQETELCFEAIIREDRSVLDLLRSDRTYLNERLAKHYEIPHVHGSQFRPVSLTAESHRGGLLRHASVLTVTSYATRTSPTIRGNWVLENILGTPAPPPPPNVPALKEKKTLESTPVRERLAAHRENPACASCHQLMDPIGFSLENFDALGRWREHEGELPIDASGTLPDGQAVASVDDLEAALLKRPELFVEALTEKLLTFALGRGIGLEDGPAVRSIVEQSAGREYRFSAMIEAIVLSPPFLMRETED